MYVQCTNVRMFSNFHHCKMNVSHCCLVNCIPPMCVYSKINLLLVLGATLDLCWNDAVCVQCVCILL